MNTNVVATWWKNDKKRNRFYGVGIDFDYAIIYLANF